MYKKDRKRYLRKNLCKREKTVDFSFEWQPDEQKTLPHFNQDKFWELFFPIKDNFPGEKKQTIIKYNVTFHLHFRWEFHFSLGSTT